MTTEEREYCRICGYERSVHESQKVQWVTDGCEGKFGPELQRAEARIEVKSR